MILSVTFSARRAVVFIQTRVDALFVDAALIRWTIVVTLASDDSADIARISSVSAQTATLSLVVTNVALGIDSARIIDQTRINAVLVDASLVRFALGIAATADSSTSDVRVAFVAFRARADRAMSFDDALSVGSAVAWISTLSVDASFGVRALTVDDTSGLGWRQNLLTFAIEVGHPKFRA